MDATDRFTAIFDSLAPRVYAYARRHTDAASAQDVVAETFLVAWRRIVDVPDRPLREGTLTLHIGTDEVATVTGPVVTPLRRAVDRWGNGTNTLRADANLYGATPDTAHLTYWVATPAPRGRPDADGEHVF